MGFHSALIISAIHIHLSSRIESCLSESLALINLRKKELPLLIVETLERLEFTGFTK